MAEEILFEGIPLEWDDGWVQDLTDTEDEEVENEDQ